VCLFFFLFYFTVMFFFSPKPQNPKTPKPREKLICGYV
jgi:hypothetical protein